jgi:competence/damage-inducible protein CinA-like protein
VNANVVRAGIVVTGTEVVAGRVSDRNGPWISERLGELGADVTQIVSVPDRAGDLEAALEFLASQGVDLIVTSGGLGPTADDLTAEVVARFAGRELVLDQGMEKKIARILARFARRVRFDADALREANRKQAMVPRGAATIDPAGTAPGLVVPTDGPTVIVLPGPPRELQAMWPAALKSEFVRAVLSRATPFRGYTLRLIGIPESEIAKTLREVERQTDLGALEITTCLRGGELEIEVRYREGADAAADAVRAAVRQRHARYLFSEDGTTIDQQVAALLRGRRVGLAESCSGGLLAARLTRLPGASEYVAGSVVAYSNQAKSDLLGVDPELIARRGAVSPEVAEAMVDGALERFHADTAVSITGIAGPEGGTKEKPVGYVCFCAKLAGGPSLARDPVIPGSRQDIRERSALVGLHMLRVVLGGGEAPL